MNRAALLCLVLISTCCPAWSRTDKAAQSILTAAGSGPGLCLLPQDVDGVCATALASSSKWTVIALANPAKIPALRAEAARSGLLNTRLFFEPANKRWPLADMYADVIVVTDQTTADGNEVVRTLVPGGKALLRGSAPATLAKRLTAGIAKAGWTVIVKPPLAGAADWSHWNRAADNNTLSPDSALRLPFHTQFLQGPPVSYSSLTFASGGRYFVLGIEPGRSQELVCRGGYNGIELWRVAIPYMPGQADQRGDIVVAARDIVYLAEGAAVRRFDAATGAELPRITPQGLSGAIEWIGLEGSVLYFADTAAATTVGAYDVGQARTLWTDRQQGTVDERMIAVRDSQIVFYVYTKHLRCLNGQSGKPVWTDSSRALVDTLERGKTLFGNPRFHVRGNAPGLVLTPQLVFVREPMGPNLVAVSRADGKLVAAMTNGTEFMNAAALYDEARGEVYAFLADEDKKVGPVSLDSRTAQQKGQGAAGRFFNYYRCGRITGSAASLYQHDGPPGVVYNRAECDNTKIVANGILYSVSGSCRCTEILNGQLALSTGDSSATVAVGRSVAQQEKGWDRACAFGTSAGDWTQYRADSSHSAGSTALVGAGAKVLWWTVPGAAPGPPAAAGGKVFLVSRDGQVRCLDAKNGKVVWTFRAGSAVRLPPTIWSSRAYVGSADGYLYCLEAATGRQLWRFRPDAGPQRLIEYFSTLASDRPVNSGAVVRGSADGKGTVFAAAGMLPVDGVCVYALDAQSGAPQWQNPCTTPRPQPVTALGSLVLDGDALLMAGRTQPAPAMFSTQDGKLIEPKEPTTAPFYLPGREVMAWSAWVLYGGVYLHEFQGSLPTIRWAFGQPFSWAFFRAGDRERPADVMPFGLTAVPPAWDSSLFVCATFMDGALCAWKPAELDAWLNDILAAKGGKDFELNPTYGGEKHQLWRLKDETLRKPTMPGRILWGPVTGEARALAVAGDAVLALMADSAVGSGNKKPGATEAQMDKELEYDWAVAAPKAWFLRALGKADGRKLWEVPLPAAPIRDGLALDAAGRIVVCLTDGRALCVGR
jgi:outer membrane protein assembly factor BamB